MDLKVRGTVDGSKEGLVVAQVTGRRRSGGSLRPVTETGTDGLIGWIFEGHGWDGLLEFSKKGSHSWGKRGQVSGALADSFGEWSQARVATQGFQGLLPKGGAMGFGEVGLAPLEQRGLNAWLVSDCGPGGSGWITGIGGWVGRNLELLHTSRFGWLNVEFDQTEGAVAFLSSFDGEQGFGSGTLIGMGGQGSIGGQILHARLIGLTPQLAEMLLGEGTFGRGVGIPLKELSRWPERGVWRDGTDD